MRHDELTKEYEAKYKEFKAKIDEVKKSASAELNDFANKWLKKVTEYRVGDVLEVVNNKRQKFQRMVIYDFGIQTFDGCPIVSAYGWWLDKENNPVKWNGSGYPVFNANTSYKMELSIDQTNKPVKS